jgi:hypothetical protein
MIDYLDEIIKERYGSWTEYCEVVGKDKRNIKRYFERNISKLNELLQPLGVELTLKEKYNIKVPAE